MYSPPGASFASIPGPLAREFPGLEWNPTLPEYQIGYAPTAENQYSLRISKMRHACLAFCATGVSDIFGRNVSKDDILSFLSRCGQDPLFPLLTALLGFGFGLSYCGQSLVKGMELTKDCIILEDACGARNYISMSICQRFSVLKAHLEGLYEGTTGESLVKAGQFHLLYRSRNGPIICDSDWSNKGRMKPGTYVVMSVYINACEARCMSCRLELTVLSVGEFYWRVRPSAIIHS